MTAVYQAYMRIMRTTKTQKLEFRNSAMIDQIDYWIIASYIALVMFIGIFNSRDEKKS